MVCALLLVAAPVVQGQTAPLADLQKELVDVRRQIADSYTQLAEKSKELGKRQHDLEYSDPVARKIRERIVEIERELLALRQQLDDRLRTIEGMREIEKERRALFDHIQGLKEKERVILQEVTSAEYQQTATEAEKTGE